MQRIGTWGGVRVLLAVASILGTGCVDTTEEPVTQQREPIAPELQLPLIQLLEGEYDGNEFRFNVVEPQRMVEVGHRAGVSAEALSSVVSCAGSSCTGSYVALANGTTTFTAPWADTVDCGTSPAGGTDQGVCRNIVVRNTFSTQLERVYVRFSSLTATGNTTAVSMPGSPYVFNAAVDFGVSASAVTNGLRRIGELPAAQTSGGQGQFWSFTGTTMSSSDTLTFRFIVEVYGNQASPTTQMGTGAISTSSSSAVVSENGAYAVWATSGIGGIVRHAVSGGNTTVGSGCTTSQPTISADGNVIAFAARGASCTLPGATTINQVYVYDFTTSTATLASHVEGDSTTAGDSLSQFPRISGDGSAVVYQSLASDVVSGSPAGRATTGACIEVFRYDVGNDENVHVSGVRNRVFGTEWVSGDCSLVPSGLAPDLNSDGSLIVFSSGAALDATADTNGNCDTYVYDHIASTNFGRAVVYRVSLDASGAQLSSGVDSNACSAGTSAISPDGSTVAFSSTQSLSTTQDRGDATTSSMATVGGTTRALFVRSSSSSASSTLQIATHTPGAAGSPSSQAAATGTSPLGPPVLSTDGRYVAFVSGAASLASQAGNSMPTGGGANQVYVCDMRAVSTSLHRCFVASATYSGPTPSLQASSQSGARPGFAYADSNGTGYVSYLVGTTAWLSPVGDPRYQQNANVN